MVYKWNFKKREYEQCKVPESWSVSCYETNIVKIINCAGCGKGMRYGAGYTSRQIHTKHGFGYAVCGECYEKDMVELYKSKSQGRV